MAKEISCKVLKVYCQTDETEYGDTRMCEISWNNRPCSGVDIRKYDKSRDAMFKGITVTYKGLEDIVTAAIEHGLVDTDVVKMAIDKRENSVFGDEDFAKLFKKMNHESEAYKRDKYGMLRDDDGRIVISARRKGLK